MAGLRTDIFIRSNFLAPWEDALSVSAKNSPPETILLKSPSQKQGPDLTVSPTYHDFGGVPLYSPRTLLVTFSNEGTSMLRVRGISTSNYVFSPSSSSLNVPPGESRTLRVTFTPYSEQTYFGSISFQTNDSNYASGSIYVTGRGVPY